MTPEQRLPSGWLKREGGCAETEVSENLEGQRQQARDQGPWPHPASRSLVPRLQRCGSQEGSEPGERSHTSTQCPLEPAG